MKSLTLIFVSCLLLFSICIGCTNSDLPQDEPTPLSPPEESSEPNENPDSAEPGETVWIEYSKDNPPPEQLRVINETLESVFVFVDGKWNQLVPAWRKIQVIDLSGGNASIDLRELGITGLLSMERLLGDIHDTATHTLELRNEHGDKVYTQQFTKHEIQESPPTITIPASPSLRIINQTGNVASICFNSELIDSVNINEEYVLCTLARPIDIPNSVGQYQLSAKSYAGITIWDQVYSWQELDNLDWKVVVPPK